MAKQKTLESRIKAEERRLTKIFADIDEKKKNSTQGLIQRAAFMRVSLEDLEAEINSAGFTELFSQGEQEPYLRERPTSKIYNSLNSNYQKIIKQLTDLLPKDEKIPQGGDEFDQF